MSTEITITELKYKDQEYWPDSSKMTLQDIKILAETLWTPITGNETESDKDHWVRGFIAGYKIK